MLFNLWQKIDLLAFIQQINCENWLENAHIFYVKLPWFCEEKINEILRGEFYLKISTQAIIAEYIWEKKGKFKHKQAKKKKNG